MYAKGIFDKEDIEKFEVTKDLVKVLDEDTFLGMAKQGFPKEISFKSSEIVQEYLERYSGATLIELAKLGYVNPEELIQLTEYQSNLLYDETLKVDNKKLLELYTPELMAILISQERIDGKSLSIYRHNLLSMLNEEEQIELLGMVSKELHKTYKEEQQYIEKMLSLHEMGFIPKDVIENMNPSQHAIEELYLNEGLSLEDIVKLFNSSIIDEQVLKGIFSFDEIIEMVNSGELNERAIFSMGKKDLNNTLKQNLVAGKLEIRSILNLYVNYDGISIEDFNSIYRDTNQLEELLNLLPDNCNKQKIKELYVNYLISHSDLLELKNRGIITEEDFKEFSKELGKAEFYSMFSNGSSVYNCSEKLEEGSQKGMQVMGQNISACESAYKITTESRKKLFEEMGAHKNFIEMEELSDDDKEVPFKGYSIIGFPDFELVVLENFEKWNNATYIMAYQQFAYYINNSQKTKKVFEGSKKTLRESSMLGEAVRVRIHTKNWGALVIDSMCELSEDARKQLKPEQECTSKIDDLVKAIAKDFER